MKSRTIDALRNRVMTDQGVRTVSHEMKSAQDAIPNEGVAIPLDSSGAIGVDPWAPGGEGEIVQTGVATSYGGPGLALQTKRLKQSEHNHVPCNFYEYPEIAITANNGVVKDVEAGFPIHSMIIDNYSNIWLYVDGAQRYIPPGVVGTVLSVFAAPTKLRITAAAPPGVTQPDLSTPAGVISVQLYEELREYSPGLGTGIVSIPVTLEAPATAVPILAAANGTATQAITDITGATVAAGAQFDGNVMISVAAENAPVTATGTLQVKVTWVPGTGGTTTNPVAVIDLSLPATSATSLQGAFDSGQITVPINVAAGSTAGKFRCTVTSTGTISGMIWDVVVNGVVQ